jgi:hypothetical protein
VALQKYFSHPSLVIYSFATPPIKTEIGTANRWGTTDSKPHGPIIMMMGQSKILSNSQITFITFFSARAQHCWLVGWLVGWLAFYQPWQTVQLC